jgi:hypothetical protein
VHDSSHGNSRRLLDITPYRIDPFRQPEGGDLGPNWLLCADRWEAIFSLKICFEIDTSLPRQGVAQQQDFVTPNRKESRNNKEDPPEPVRDALGQE